MSKKSIIWILLVILIVIIGAYYIVGNKDKADDAPVVVDPIGFDEWTPVEGTVESPLAAAVWVWTETVSGDESVVTPNRADAFTLTFSSDGRVIGTTDCNGFNGRYQEDGMGGISFGPFATTMMFCEGSQEGVFTGDLLNVSHFVFDANGNLVLNLKLDSGNIYFKKQ